MSVLNVCVSLSISILQILNIFILKPIQDVLRLVEKGYKLEPPEGTPAFIVDLMRDCWLLSPTARPTFAEILNILTEECDIGGENGS